MAYRERVEGFEPESAFDAARLALTLKEVPRLHPKRRPSLPHRPNTLGNAFKKSSELRPVLFWQGEFEV